MRVQFRVVSGVLLSLVVVLAGLARIEARQAASESATHAVVPADKVVFEPIEVPGFDSGMKIAVVHGNPDADSGMYVLRLQFPSGYRFPAHWHPMAENLTVLSGEFLLGMGDKADYSKVVSYKPGAFLFVPGKMSHFGGAKGATIIQLHGQAPFKIELTKPQS